MEEGYQGLKTFQWLFPSQTVKQGLKSDWVHAMLGNHVPHVQTTSQEIQKLASQATQRLQVTQGVQDEVIKQEISKEMGNYRDKDGNFLKIGNRDGGGDF